MKIAAVLLIAAVGMGQTPKPEVEITNMTCYQGGAHSCSAEEIKALGFVYPKPKVPKPSPRVPYFEFSSGIRVEWRKGWDCTPLTSDAVDRVLIECTKGPRRRRIPFRRTCDSH